MFTSTLHVICLCRLPSLINFTMSRRSLTTDQKLDVLIKSVSELKKSQDSSHKELEDKLQKLEDNVAASQELQEDATERAVKHLRRDKPFEFRRKTRGTTSVQLGDLRTCGVGYDPLNEDSTGIEQGQGHALESEKGVGRRCVHSGEMPETYSHSRPVQAQLGDGGGIHWKRCCHQ